MSGKRNLLLCINFLIILMFSACNYCEGEFEYGEPGDYFIKTYNTSIPKNALGRIGNLGNYSDENGTFSCYVGNDWYDYEIELEEELKRHKDKLRKKLSIKNKERKECYDSGYEYNVSLDLIKDHKLTCNQIKVIHSDRLIKSIYVHYDCNNKTKHWEDKLLSCKLKTSGAHFGDNRYNCFYEGLKDAKETKYYEEDDFINYYVNKCLIGSN